MPPHSEDLSMMVTEYYATKEIGWKPMGHDRRTETLHEQFDNAVIGREILPALVDGSNSMCFAEVQTRSNDLARELLTTILGIETTNAPVGVCLDGMLR